MYPRVPLSPPFAAPLLRACATRVPSESVTRAMRGTRRTYSRGCRKNRYQMSPLLLPARIYLAYPRVGRGFKFRRYATANRQMNRRHY